MMSVVQQNVTENRFEGYKDFTETQLSSHVSIQKKKFLFDRGKFSQDLLKKSAASLTALYRNEGFAKVAVTPAVADREPDIEVTFRIDEGPQDRVRDLKIVNQEN